SVNSVTRRSVGGLRGGAAGLRLLQKDPDPHADEHGEQEGGEGADQKVLGELTVLELLEAGEGLRGDDPTHRGVVAEQHHREGEQRHDEQRIHADSVSRSARNILSPAATRGQAMRRARWEIALRSTSSRAAAAAGSLSRSRVAVRRWRGVQLQYNAEQ